MSSVRRTLLVALLAVLGIALAAAITWGTSQLVRQHIGLASEPLTAGQRLLPPAVGRQAPRTVSTARPAPASTGAGGTLPAPASPTTTTSPPAPRETTSSAAPPALPPERTATESVPPLTGGSGHDGGDSGSHRDD
ncbi:MAG TPA: hypothetical protein VES97_11160 [Solirubrobacteraceae bacterium]|nr:hypothetical protein [Solirubrobacteraceae bacterium]